jgi:hypothetical protein
VECPEYGPDHLFRDEDSDEYRPFCPCGAVDPCAGRCICCEEAYTLNRINWRFLCTECEADGYEYLCFKQPVMDEPPF